MKLSERLVSLRQQREAKVKAMEGLLQKATDEDRSFDDTEQAAFDDHGTGIKKLDKEIDNCEEMEKMMVKSAIAATNRSEGGTTVDLGDGRRLAVVRNLPKGAAFTRYAMSLAAAKGNTMAAAEIAKSTWSKDTPEVEAVLRAAVAAGTTTDTNWAAPLVNYQVMSSEFIDLIRAETFIGRMTGFRNVPFNVRMQRQLTGATAGWVGEGAPKPMSALSFDLVTIPHTKLATIVAITEELARFSTPSAEAAVRQDLVSTISTFIDQQMITPSVAAVADVSPASLTYGATTTDSTGSTVAAITNDLNAAMTAMAVANIPQRNRYWLMHPRTANYLLTLRTSQDVFAFRDELSNNRLFGIPVLQSTNMPNFDQTSPSTPGSLETYIVLVEASEIFLADDGEVVIDVSREASLQFLTNPSAGATSLVSLWQNNLVGIRAERFIYWAARNPAAVQVIKNVTY